MKRCILILLLFCTPLLAIHALPRKKVAIVLSGGGAKGVAHIGALKIIEELGIPIDYIAGTSIGAVVGGLYSIGYTPEQLEMIVKQTNWIDLLSDKISRDAIPFPFKLDNNKYFISLPIKNNEKGGGIIKGRNISQLLQQLTEGYNDTINFDSLPIPFACIATDMATNQKEVIRSGKLSEAMRASMAIPVIFSPLYSDKKVLIDGGFKDNLPIDVAKSMGADIIIAIDAQSELATSDKLQTVPDVLNQLMLMICQSELDIDKVKQVDSYIKVNVEGYNAASFSNEAIDTLIIRGENAARANYVSLLSIKNKVGIVPSKKPHNTLIQLPFSPQYTPIKNNQLRAALRFDSENIAAILLNLNLQNLKTGEAEITLRGGRQSFLNAQYSLPLSKIQEISIINKIAYNDIFLYEYGQKVANPSFIQNTSKLAYLITPLDNLLFKANISLDYQRFFRTLVNQEFPYPKSNDLFLNYNVELKYETINKRYFPTKGLDFHIGYTIYTNCHPSTNYSAFNTLIKKIFPISSSIYCVPSIYGRLIFNANTPLIYSNMIGGEGYSLDFEQQIPFSGLIHTENVNNAFGGMQIKFQHTIHKKQHLTLAGNYAISEHHFSNFFHGKPIYGISVGYGYESPLGPIEGYFSYSNKTKDLGFYLNIGFGF